MTSMLKKCVIDKLDDIISKYNNAYHRTIKTKSVDIKSGTYIDFGIENICKDPKFKVDDHVKISKHKYIFTKYYVPNWSKEVLVVKKLKNTVLWTYVTEDLNGE